MEIPNEKPIKSIKKTNAGLVLSKIHPKTKLQNDGSDSPVIAGTSYGMCSSHDVETDESVVELECEKNKDTEDSSDVCDKFEVYEHTLINFNVAEPGIKTELTREEAVDDILFGKHFLDNDYEKDSDSCGNISNNQVENDEHHLSEPENIEEEKHNINLPNDEERKHICHVCQKIFTRMGDFGRHLRIHTGEKPFPCNVCKKSFNRKSCLARHMLIHSDEKPHECDVCKQLFRRKPDLNKHKLIHSGVKPFSCDVCKKSFTQIQHFIQHKRIHTGDKPFSCDLCDKSFRQKSHLIGHRRLHTGEKPFTCHICNESFAQKPTFNKHVKTHKKK